MLQFMPRYGDDHCCGNRLQVVKFFGKGLIGNVHYTSLMSKIDFNSFASEGFILPPRIKRNCLLRRAPSYNAFSSGVSVSISGTSTGLPFWSIATKVKYAELLSILVAEGTSSASTSILTSIDELNA